MRRERKKKEKSSVYFALRERELVES